MNAEQYPNDDAAQLKPLYFVALLESQILARQALQRLEQLCRLYPDQALREAVDALRRTDEHAA